MSGIRVNFAILKLDRAGSHDQNASTLYRKSPQRRFRETAFKGAMGERSGKGSNLDASHIILRTREIICQFQETTRNGAMEERSGKSSNLAAISRQQLDCLGFGC